MSKAVLLSIRPQYCELIASGEKTIEVRKTKPKIPTPFRCYMYCTKPKYPHEDFICIGAGTENARAFYGGGKVIGEFVCNEIDDYEAEFTDMQLPVDDPETCLNAIYQIWHDDDGEKYSSCVASNEIDNSYCALFNDSCLSFEEIRKYVGEGFLTEFSGWHISDLIIYDKPKELSAFKGMCKYMGRDCGACPYYDYTKMDCKVRKITRPPQSWCYVEVLMA